MPPWQYLYLSLRLLPLANKLTGSKLTGSGLTFDILSLSLSFSYCLIVNTPGSGLTFDMKCLASAIGRKWTLGGMRLLVLLSVQRGRSLD